MQTEDGNATAIQAFDWDAAGSAGVIVNLSVWTDVEHLAVRDSYPPPGTGTVVQPIAVARNGSARPEPTKRCQSCHSCPDIGLWCAV